MDHFLGEHVHVDCAGEGWCAASLLAGLLLAAGNMREAGATTTSAGSGEAGISWLSRLFLPALGALSMLIWHGQALPRTLRKQSTGRGLELLSSRYVPSSAVKPVEPWVDPLTERTAATDRDVAGARSVADEPRGLGALKGGAHE